MLTICPATTSKARRRLLAAAALLASGVAACSGVSTAEVQPPIGSIDNGSTFFFGDPSSGGLASQYRMTQVSYGRLVELFGRDETGARVPMGSDFVIGQRVTTDATNYTLQTNPVTGQEILIVERDVTSDDGRAQFIELVRLAGNQLDLIQVQDLDSSGVYSLLPRNAALMVTFSDLLNPATVDSRTVQLRTGLPPAIPFEARVFPSAYYGGQLSNGDFYPTRVVLDLTISEIEAFSVDPPLPVNGVGLPASFDGNRANAQLRVPSRLSQAIGVTEILRNLSGNPIATASNGPVDFNDATQPVTRAFRSGGRPDILADPFNGFLLDEIKAEIVGSTPINLPQAPDQIGDDENGLRFMLPTVEFLSELCGAEPQVGDVITQSGVFAEIEDPGVAASVGNGYDNIVVRLLLSPTSWPNTREWETVGQGNGSFETAFDAIDDVARAACYVQVVPAAAGFPDAPVTGISTGSLFEIRFSEPMDPTSLTAFDSVTLTRSAFVAGQQAPTSDYVVGAVRQSADLRSVTFVPQQLLAHAEGQSESYYLRLANEDDDSFPPKDLAGNAALELPEIEMSVNPQNLTVLNGGRVSRFTSIDEEAPVGAEFGGQVLIDLPRQLLRARPVITSQVAVDNSQPLMRQMTFLPGGGLGVITPHTPFGSKLQTIWRYADCSFSLLDQQDHNIDIAGLSWAPNGGGISPDSFSQFEIRLAHSRWTPDEDINPANAWPRFPLSGIVENFGNNIIGSVPADVPSQVVVHERSLGYTLDPGDLFVTSTGTTLLPFPLNRDVPFGNRTYFTWRDGDNRARGGGGNAPVDPRAYWVALGQPIPVPPIYSQGNVQSVGLPLLMEFRVFPDSNAFGINGWDFNIAVNSSARPYFRAFSSGGNNTSGANSAVNPDAESVASGGFNPGSTPPGAVTPPQDNVVQLGAIDFITRVSHANSIWFTPDIPGETSFGGRVYSEPRIEPDFGDQPVGTSLTVRFRGATAIEYLEDDTNVAGDGPNGTIDNEVDDPDTDESPGIASFQNDAFTLDVYGDFYNDVEAPVSHNPAGQNPGLTFLGPDDFWKNSVDDIRDARFYQIRLTFTGNPENGLSPEVSAFAFTWTQP